MLSPCLLTSRPASSTTAALVGTGSTPWTSWATTGPLCATRRTGIQAKTGESKYTDGPEEEPLSSSGEAARQGEHVCQSLSTRTPWHSTRHWDITVGNVHFLHLLHFCCSQWHYAQWPCWERQGTLHFKHSSRLVARQRDGSQPVKKWMKMPFFFLFFVYMCCIVKSNHASLIAVHWQMPYSAFNFLFFPPFPSPSPSPSWHLFFPVQANWCFLLWELNVGLHLTSRISDIFTQFFTNLYTQRF